MSEINKIIEEAFAAFTDPYLNRDWLSAKIMRSLTAERNRVTIELVFPYPPSQTLLNEVQTRIQPIIKPLTLEMPARMQIDAHVGKTGMKALPSIKNIIVVGSGKGGVGKSTVALNLACALQASGAKVGLLDADVYGPSQPGMLGTITSKPHIQEKTFTPVEKFGLQTMSMGYLIPVDAPMIWRGPMLGKAIEQMVYDTKWQDLDYLVVDLPPGTGDVQLTLCQKMPVSGAVIVTTPQEIALQDVTRAIEMFVKLSIPVLGIVENMSSYQCTHCGHEEALFGQGGGAKLAKRYNVDLLASLPFDLQVRALADQGEPIVLKANAMQPAFEILALKTAAKLALLPKDYSAKFPKIVVQAKEDKS